MKEENIYADIERYQKYCAEHNLKINDANNLKAFMQNDLPLFYYEKLKQALKDIRRAITLHKNIFTCYAIVEGKKATYNYDLIVDMLHDIITLESFSNYMETKANNAITKRKRELKQWGGRNE